MRLSFHGAAISSLVCFSANSAQPDFKAIAFYTGQRDQAHISFVKEANRWFPIKAAENNFSYRSTTNWAELNNGAHINF
jgi:hypothetical protein